MILAIILLFIVFALKENKLSFKALVSSLLIFSFYLYVTSEILSLFNLMTTISIRILWILTDLLLVGWIISFYRKGNTIQKFHFSKFEMVVGCIFTLFGIVCLMISSHIIPYNFDSMAYHLPRIIYWMNNQSIAHYATDAWRQIASPVFAELINLNAYLFYKELFVRNDALFNVLQSVSFLISAILVYGIAREIGCNKKFSWFALFLFISTPIAFAEGMSTQVDNVATVWLLCFVYLAIYIIHNHEILLLNSKKDYLYILLLGIAAALSYITKFNVEIGVVVFAIWLLICCKKNQIPFNKIIAWVVGVVGIAVCIVLPEVLRNIISFGSINYSGVGAQQLVGSFDPRYLLLNFIKNLLWNLPNRYMWSFNGVILATVTSLSNLFGIDLNDVAIAESNMEYKLHTVSDWGFDTAINPIITYLFIVIGIVWIVKRTRRKDKKEFGYCFYAYISMILCLVLARWELYVTRYMIAFFAVLAPAITLQLQRFSSHKITSKIINVVCIVIVLLGSRDLIGMVSFYKNDAYFGKDVTEHNQYYFKYLENYEYYNTVVDVVSDNDYEVIGTIMGDGAFQYPLLKMLNDTGAKTFTYVNVKNSTNKYEKTDIIPDVIIGVTDDPIFDTVIECHGETYTKITAVNEDAAYGNHIYIIEK